MKEDIIEYYPNGSIKHKITYHPNGNKSYDQFYNLQGNYHREQGLPDYQSWYENGILYHKTYYVYGKRHNINNPCVIEFGKNGKIQFKKYRIKGINYNKLDWMNCIKNC